MILVPLRSKTNRALQYAIIDDADAAVIATHHWYIARREDGSIRRVETCLPTGKISLPQFLLGKPPNGYVWDHEDGNPLNNRRSNLRCITQGNNARNRGKNHKPTTSKYKGVYYEHFCPNLPWKAQIADPKNRNIGRFATEVEAAHAYDQAALECFGPYARLNFPTEVQAVA